MRKKEKTKLSSKERLDKEMFSYYNRLNKDYKKREAELQKQDSLRRKQQVIFRVLLLSVFLVSIVGSWGLCRLLHLSGWPTFLIIFAIICIVLITILDLIINRDEERYKYNLKLIFEIASLLLLLAQLGVIINQNTIASQQLNISAQQTAILEKTSQSNYPELLLIPMQGRRSYRLSEFLEANKSTISIGITNIGKAMVPSATIELVNSGLFVGQVRGYREESYPPYMVVTNLRSFDYNSTFFEFSPNPYLKSNFSFGIENLTFKIRCPVCKEEIQFQSAEICFYNNTPKESCGDKWIYAY